MKIKHSLLFVFMVWMQQGQHHLKANKKNIVMNRNGKKAIVQFDENSEYLEVNEYCHERWLIFLKQWLNHGKKFIYELNLIVNRAVNTMKQSTYMELRR